MAVIQFPGEVRKTFIPQIIDHITPDDRFIVNGFDFTCPHCNHKTSFDCNGLIFKRLEFYCKECGSRHIVTNPAMSRYPSRKAIPLTIPNKTC